jgi:hypothetical protein
MSMTDQSHPERLVVSLARNYLRGAGERPSANFDINLSAAIVLPERAGSRAAGRYCAFGLVQVSCDLTSASRAFRNRRSGPVPARAVASS